MKFCSNCGYAVSDGVKFCANCGDNIDLLQDESLKKNWIDKLSKFFGIILMIIAYVDYQSDPPAFTIVLSIAIIAGAIFCLSQKYKLKGFTIVALLLAIFCLMAGIDQGKKMGFFKIPSDSDYNRSSVEDVIDEIPIVEKETTEEFVSKEPEAEEMTETEEVIETEEMTEIEEMAETVEAEKTEEENEAKTEDGVDPNLKAFLDSYEEFVDEYVVFMKKYMADPGNAISMLSEYTRMMEKYGDFAEKVDKYDSNSMSTADAKYYLEVTNRCTQKMLDIY